MTNMTLVHKEEVLETGLIRIKRGIFQGDSLSPLLFTMSLNPLSWELQKTGYGYQLDEQTKINHLLYVDDLKLYGTIYNQLTGPCMIILFQGLLPQSASNSVYPWYVLHIYMFYCQMTHMHYLSHGMKTCFKIVNK